MDCPASETTIQKDKVTSFKQMCLGTEETKAVKQEDGSWLTTEKLFEFVKDPKRKEVAIQEKIINKTTGEVLDTQIMPKGYLAVVSQNQSPNGNNKLQEELFSL